MSNAFLRLGTETSRVLGSSCPITSEATRLLQDGVICSRLLLLSHSIGRLWKWTSARTTTGNKQWTTSNGQRATDSRRRTTDDEKQTRAADNEQQTTSSRQQKEQTTGQQTAVVDRQTQML
ncbi:hypothetical protein E4U54_006171 [Claviceps lovelessii]|nr:hypothetical protein E4U54_006171 [Claviceps lovelessii]